MNKLLILCLVLTVQAHATQKDKDGNPININVDTELSHKSVLVDKSKTTATGIGHGGHAEGGKGGSVELQNNIAGGKVVVGPTTGGSVGDVSSTVGDVGGGHAEGGQANVSVEGDNYERQVPSLGIVHVPSTMDCVIGYSGGAANSRGLLSLGFGRVNKECMIRKDFAHFVSMKFYDAASRRICQSKEIIKAFEDVAQCRSMYLAALKREKDKEPPEITEGKPEATGDTEYFTVAQANVEKELQQLKARLMESEARQEALEQQVVASQEEAKTARSEAQRVQRAQKAVAVRIEREHDNEDRKRALDLLLERAEAEVRK